MDIGVGRAAHDKANGSAKRQSVLALHLYTLSTDGTHWNAEALRQAYLILLLPFYVEQKHIDAVSHSLI